jgi:hypothetical protein
MAYRSELWLLVLHGVRLKGFGEPDDIAAIVGVSKHVVVENLEKAQADALVLRRDSGRLTGWSLTAEGRAEQERLLRAEIAASGYEATVRSAYERFLAMNKALLHLCTDWQMVDETTLNEHDDPAYDAAVIERLRTLHGELEPILAELEGTLDRYAGYRPRFASALEKLGAGDGDWFTKPMIDSYHTVWFQLHEDLLNTLGIERAKEATS